MLGLFLSIAMYSGVCRDPVICASTFAPLASSKDTVASSDHSAAWWRGVQPIGLSVPFGHAPASSIICRISSLASLLFVLPQRRRRADSNELWQSTSAPRANSFRTAPAQPSRAATISGVLLQEFLASMSAPAAAKISIASALSYSAASLRGVSLLICLPAISTLPV